MRLVLVLFSFMIAAFTYQEDDPKTILFYGDSITAGYGIGTELAFPELIRKKFLEKNKEVAVINAGLSGETSAGGLTRIDWILNRKFDVFVLELGANDGLRGLPVSETEKNLQAIIDKVKAKYPDAKIVLTGMKVPPNMGPDYSEQFADVFPRLAKKNHTGLFPFLLKDVAGNPELNQPDGIHPNARGHEIIASNLFPVLAGILGYN